MTRSKFEQMLQEYPLTMAYITLCTWVTMLVTILEMR